MQFLAQWMWATGDPHQLCQHTNPHAVSSDICLAMDIYSPKWGDSDPQCSADMPHRCHPGGTPLGLEAVERVSPQQELCPLHILGAIGVTKTWTALKWACLQVTIALANSPFIITLIALSMILESTTTGTFLT